MFCITLKKWKHSTLLSCLPNSKITQSNPSTQFSQFKLIKSRMNVINRKWSIPIHRRSLRNRADPSFSLDFSFTLTSWSGASRHHRASYRFKNFLLYFVSWKLIILSSCLCGILCGIYCHVWCIQICKIIIVIALLLSIKIQCEFWMLLLYASG